MPRLRHCSKSARLTHVQGELGVLGSVHVEGVVVDLVRAGTHAPPHAICARGDIGHQYEVVSVREEGQSYFSPYFVSCNIDIFTAVRSE